MILQCQWCNKQFDAKRRDTKYCSRACQGQASRNRIKQGVNSSEKVCSKCGKSFIIKQNAYNRRYCYDCMPETYQNGAQARQLIKKWALEYKGNKCQLCGYNKCIEALEFHHNNPNEKEFIISDRNLVLDWQQIKHELDKCSLLCANCHRELHTKLLKGDDYIEIPEEE